MRPLPLLTLAILSCAWAGRAAALDFGVGPTAGGVTLLDSRIFPAESGGFVVYEAAGKRRIDLPAGAVDRSGGAATFTCEKPGDLRITARFENRGAYVLVSGAIENLRPGDRGVILDYRLPVPGPGAVFSNDPDVSTPVTSAETEGNVYPIAAMADANGGMAIAIPPTAPCEFGMVGSTEGLAVRYYLGLSPDTLAFPNRAAFSFMLYPVDAAWGFRSALAKYYAAYPDYYTNRSGVDGQFLFPAEDGKEPDPPDLSRYGYSCVETQAPWLQRYLDRDRRAGILSLPYMIVGMREIKFLKTLPKDYAAAMDAYAHWSLADNAGYPITKENEAGGRDVHLREQVDSSVCIAADGRREIDIRHTPWGLNSVTFKTNPNPDLFADAHVHSVGRDAIDLVEAWCDKYPEVSGVTIDSLGGNWPANFNYNRDQFRYARYPLTCDPSGRVAIHNEISHYEFLETLRKELRAKEGPDRSFISANGIYCYAVRPDLPQHYRTSAADNRIWLGRFFLASQLDFAVSEPGIISPDRSLAFMRAAMGRKVYSPTNARFEDFDKVRNWINKCLLYGLFGVDIRRYGDTTVYYVPKGYERDRPLMDWFVPKVRLLSRAGWEPVTYAKASGSGVRVERYGDGDRVYFAVLSEGDRDQPCVLTVDLASLGFEATGYPRRWLVDEIAQGAPVRIVGPGRIQFQIAPYRTCIVALTRQPAR